VRFDRSRFISLPGIKIASGNVFLTETYKDTTAFGPGVGENAGDFPRVEISDLILNELNEF
jgi:hypothetical protein